MPAAALAYALLKPQHDPIADAAGGDAATAIKRTVVGAVLAAAALTGAVIVADDALPSLVVSATAFSSMASYITVLVLIVSVTAFLMVWRRRTSILDEWLLVALTAFVAEAPIIILLGASRYTSSFYSSRLLALLASCAVLVALLSEMTRLYVRLSRAIAELQRERATKLMNLDVVVSSIGHEIRQPLTVTRMCTEIIETLLKKPRLDIDEVRENLEDISSSTVRIAETIDNLRGLFRNPHEDAELFDVNDVVADSLRTLKTSLDERGIVVTRTFAADLPRVNGHRGQLREVFLNILQNAIDAMTPPSDRQRMLLVVTSRLRDGVSVTIGDSGPGIEPARLPNIFTAFISTKPFGMGLGLSICRMIVDRHSGQLLVSSELDKGTVFEVRLPAEPGAADASLAGPARVEA
jgi:signal transduction histidine kinase